MSRPRNREYEREATCEAARGVVDPTPLIEFSEARISRLSGEYVTDPMLVATGRDWLRDAREELSDCRNYLVWWLEENHGDDKAHDTFLALRQVALAYDLLWRD